MLITPHTHTLAHRLPNPHALACTHTHTDAHTRKRLTYYQDKSGRITSVNNSVCYMFGYKKNELVNKNCNMIMPTLYANNHNEIIQRFADSGLAAPRWKDKLVFGKASSGYIFPVIINTRAIYNVYLVFRARPSVSLATVSCVAPRFDSETDKDFLTLAFSQPPTKLIR